MPKWRRKPDERPGQILDAALDVFSEKGFRAATMQDVAEAAGITKGTIYLYFKSKRELFVAVLKEEVERVIDGLPEVDVQAAADLDGLARNWGGALLDTLMTPRVGKLAPLVLSEWNNLPEMERLYREEVLPKANLQLAALLEQGMAAGAVRRANPIIAARCLLGMFFVFVLTQEVLGAKEVTPMAKEDIVDTIVTIFFRGLLQEEAIQ